ncbi:MAG: DNA polymerase III subunit gamma/tau, partial [Oscillospiraceae bacterium]|nr:DNA polymerase III subunit gamma/tau [Oscillospiraceae bacterium]
MRKISRKTSVERLCGQALILIGGERLYLALYRKYRPRTFDDVISQEHITTTLKNQIISGSTAHAYLFTGSRGTGKTTCAKILSMAVNCLAPKDGSPCLECERCKEIMDGTTTDIVEMDAASNNGVDDVRQLRDEVAYTPVSCKYRVYIIDEAHMLSTQAFNALLKTIEEPPPHVKFILATTELNKVPATILSRCQRFEFRRVDIADSADRLLDIAEKEGVSLERDAAELISRLSDGGMRDALSVLDRCISADTRITTNVVRECAGVADKKHLFAFMEMIARKDTAGCIRLLSELHKGSKDIALIVNELSEQYRDFMLYKAAPNDTDLLTALPDELPELARISDMYTLADILRCITLLQQCADGVGRAKQRKTLAEMCFVRLCAGTEMPAEQPAQVKATAVPAAVTPVAPPAPTVQSAPKPAEPAQPAQRYAEPEPPPLTDDDAPPLDDDYPIPSPPVPSAAPR